MKTIRIKDEKDLPKNFTGIAICPLPNLSGTATIWSLRGMIHRIDGPAVEWDTGEKLYLVLTKGLTKEEFDRFRGMWEITLLEKTEDLMKAFVKLVKVK